jgi:hypothetical protein
MDEALMSQCCYVVELNSLALLDARGDFGFLQP